MVSFDGIVNLVYKSILFYFSAENQRLMAEEGAVECLISLLDSSSELIQRQSSKALANLGVNNENKAKIADCGGIPKLVSLASSKALGVKIEAIAALANLAVNGNTFHAKWFLRHSQFLYR